MIKIELEQNHYEVITNQISCRTCRYYSFGYGLGNYRKDGGMATYLSCDFNKKITKECKAGNFLRWEA